MLDTNTLTLLQTTGGKDEPNIVLYKTNGALKKLQHVLASLLS
jgi:hypothetical protein